ncbi:MAG: outer membrane protein [Nitrospirota bacterium]
MTMTLCVRTNHFARTALAGFIAALMFFSSSQARAELILGAEVRITVEDNIVGLLTGDGDASGSGGAMGGTISAAGGKGFGAGAGSGTGNYTGGGNQSPGDISVTALVELGGMAKRGGRLSFFAKGFAERTDYQTYSEYDSNIAGITAGMTARLGDKALLRIAGSDKIKRYDNDPDRDGTAYGGSASLKQLVTDRVWLRGSAEYETYRAEVQDFRYRGAAYRFTAGYDLTDDLLATAGYRFQSQQYRDSAATALRSGTAVFGADYALTDHWSAGLLYERQIAGTGTSDIITRNNLFSLAIRWDY